VNIERFLQTIALTDFAADPAHGIVVARTPFDFDRASECAKDAGGWAIEFDEDGRAKKLPTTGLPADLFEKLRRAFDPDSKLDPVPFGQ
ncbi:MAG TPA: hypothetical protein PK402_09520, partial [Tepidisphaeraceae bacterium]|nr:hypothetical protein [Tepidisphaeraceae bacterium]